MFPIGRKSRGKKKDPEENDTNTEELVESTSTTSTATKRKRASPSSSSSSTKKPKAKPKANSKSSTQIDSLPPSLQAIVRLFESLNTVHTFLKLKGDVIIPSFDNIKSSLGGNTQLSDIVQLSVIAPSLLSVICVERKDLDRELASYSKSPSSSSKYLSQRGREISYLPSINQQQSDQPPKNEKVILIQFLDGAEKNKTSTSVSSKTLTNVITKRNALFQHLFIEFCELHSSDSEEIDADSVLAYLKTQVEALLPALTSTDSTVTNKDDTQENTDLPFLSLPNTIETTPSNRLETLFKSVLFKSALYKSQVIEENGWFTVPARSAIFGSHVVLDGDDVEEVVSGCDDADVLQKPVPKAIMNALKDMKGIEKFYSHQIEAMNALNEEIVKAVVLMTSTSSGKSLVFQVPLLCELEQSVKQLVARQDLRSIPDFVRINDEGKECFSEDVLLKHLSTAFFVFPTKALSQDQLRSLKSLVSLIPSLSWISVNTYDGDTPTESRKTIRGESSIIFTNPDMLHVSILPHHRYWSRFLQNLKYIVLDEIHVYSGFFGANVALILRRLQRVCEFYGNNSVKIICCSATLMRNPLQHTQTILNIPTTDSIRLITRDGSPQGPKHYLLWNPPPQNPLLPTQGRISSFIESANLIIFAARYNLRLIAFCPTRKSCELLLKHVHLRLESLSRGNNSFPFASLIPKIVGYRGGYTPTERREIESRMFTGELLAIISTNALELGIDIGSLDIVLHLGFPGSMSSYVQQCGRVGRTKRDAMSVLVAEGNSLVDQFFVERPRELWKVLEGKEGLDDNNDDDDENEQDDSEITDFHDPTLLERHLQCAAEEIPITITTDSKFFTYPQFTQLVQQHLRYGKSDNRYYVSKRFDSTTPSLSFSIRDGSGLMLDRNDTKTDESDEEPYKIINTTTHSVIELMEPDQRALLHLYEGSIFLHQGKSYIITSVDASRKLAKCSVTNIDFITSPRDFTDLDVKTVSETYSKSSVAISKGILTSTTKLFGYTKHHILTKKVLEIVTFEDSSISALPDFVTEYSGLWIDIPSIIISKITQERQVIINSLPEDEQNDWNIEFGIHGINHCLARLTRSVISDNKTKKWRQSGLKPECKHPLAKRFRPARMVLFDPLRFRGVNGDGSVLLKMVYESLPKLIREARGLVRDCKCENGCIECGLVWTNCKEANSALSKKMSLRILNELCIYLKEEEEEEEEEDN